MNSRIRTRALRNFVASLLLSELSAREMHQLADELIYGNLGAELGDLIRHTAQQAIIDGSKRDLGRNKNQSERGKNLSSSQDSRLRVALSAVNRRRLSKKATWELMQIASPSFDSGSLSNDAPLKEFLTQYFSLAPPTEIARFLNLLEGETTDPYLKGIAKRG